MSAAPPDPLLSLQMKAIEFYSGLGGWAAALQAAKRSTTLPLAAEVGLGP